MARILNTREITTFDCNAIRATLVEAADAIYFERGESGAKGGLFANIPVNKPISEAPLEQVLAESYIVGSSISYQCGGHVMVKHREDLLRYGAGDHLLFALPPDAMILAVQPYLPPGDRIPPSKELLDWEPGV